MTYTGAGKRGFTLLELSIVLVIIAIVTGVSMQMGISVVATARQVTTQKKMKMIEDALLAFRTANDRLPCPGDLTLALGNANLGIEGATPGTCTGGAPAANFASGTAVEGALPAVTLGLPADFMVDGWGNRFRYAVDTAMTAAGAFSTTPLGANCGPLTVNDAHGNARSTKAMYALVSHGANGHGAYTKSGVTTSAGSVNAKELINCHCNSSGAATGYSPTYVQMDATQDPANSLNGFDDLVVYKERWQFRMDWDAAGGQCTAIYVADQGNYRVQKFDGTGNYLSQFGSNGTGDGQFSGVGGIAIDGSGNIWVSDFTNARVEKFDSTGNYVSKIANAFRYPANLAVDSSNNLYVADSNENRVAKYSSSGTWLYDLGTAGIGNQSPVNGQMYTPYGVAVDASNNVYVADTYNNRVQKFSSTGTWLFSIGGPAPHTCQTAPNGVVPACDSGTDDGQFNLPMGVAVDVSGNIWVSDTYNSRVQKFDSSGNFLLKFGAYGGGGCAPGTMDQAESITTDSQGNVYISDVWCFRVSKYDSTGNYLSTFGTSGSGNGQFQYPFGIAISGR